MTNSENAQVSSNERLVTLISFAEACSKPWIAVDVVAALKELQERRVADAQTAELRRDLANARELIANAIGGTHETLPRHLQPDYVLSQIMNNSSDPWARGVARTYLMRSPVEPAAQKASEPRVSYNSNGDAYLVDPPAASEPEQR